MNDHSAHEGVQVILEPEEFADDLDSRLGRANGNIYQRIKGVEGVHDGQVMVRLKKKRFIILDYSIVPTQQDIEYASLNPRVSVPVGAGKAVCTSPECSKVGIPVLLYDSDPDEPASLYLRSGLCFMCQRALNEKRRTQKKRSSDSIADPSGVFSGGSAKKKVKGASPRLADLDSDTIMLHMHPADSLKTYRAGYSFQEIGNDLVIDSRQAAFDVDHLIRSATHPESSAGMLENEHGNNGTLLHSHDGISANGHPHPGMSSAETVNLMYNKAWQSLSRSMHLLNQWKQAWDSVVSVTDDTVGDAGLAEAVASAAAVAVMGNDQNNMVSLLLAADQRKDGTNDHDETVFDNGERGINEPGNIEAYEV